MAPARWRRRSPRGSPGPLGVPCQPRYSRRRRSSFPSSRTRQSRSECGWLHIGIKAPVRPGDNVRRQGEQGIGRGGAPWPLDPLVHGGEVTWLQPVPDSLLHLGDHAGAAIDRGSLRLAFVAAMQHLPRVSAVDGQWMGTREAAVASVAACRRRPRPAHHGPAPAGAGPHERGGITGCRSPAQSSPVPGPAAAPCPRGRARGLRLGNGLSPCPRRRGNSGKPRAATCRPAGSGPRSRSRYGRPALGSRPGRGSVNTWSVCSSKAPLSPRF